MGEEQAFRERLGEELPHMMADIDALRDLMNAESCQNTLEHN
jgi:hypothetical protein